jgi:hypothetical protein
MNMYTVLGGLISVIVAASAAVGAALLIHRLVPVARRQANNDVAGLAFAIIGVLYAILLTFVTMSVWTTGDNARSSSRQEAQAVVDVDRYADCLDPAADRQLHELTSRYVAVVVGQEWPRMTHGQTVGATGGQSLDRVWQFINTHHPAGDNDADRQSEARTDLRSLEVARSGRLAAVDAGLPLVMWLALLVGAVLTVVNAMMFGVQGTGEYLAIIAMLAAMSALLLFAVYELEYPYQRGAAIHSDVFTTTVGGLGGRLDAP